MIRRSLLALGLAVITTAGAQPAAAATKRPRCPAKHASTLASGDSGRVVARRSDPGDEYGPTTTLYLCRPGGRRVRRLSFGEGESVSIRLARFTPRYLAFVTDTTDIVCTKYQPSETCSRSYVQSFDMRTGRRRSSETSGATAFVLASNGWIAWVLDTPAAPVLARVAGKTRTLDAGPADAASLAIAGVRATWLRDGAEQSADLTS